MTAKKQVGGNSKKATELDQVEAHLKKLNHPLKKELEAVRTIIRTSHPELRERIKWNAPSYYFDGEDIVTFGPPRKEPKVLLVFHHPMIVKIKSDLLTGDYKDRRLTYFSNMKEVKAGKSELVRIMNEVIGWINRK